MQHHSYENDFDLHQSETACRTHFHMKGFALRLVLKQRHKRTQKWPGYLMYEIHNGVDKNKNETLNVSWPVELLSATS